MLAAPRWTCLNIHPSLLPSYRGTNPVYWALAENQSHTGITIHTMDEGIDTGAIVAQCETPIRPEDTHHTLYLRLAQMGSILLRDTLRQAARTGALPRQAQPPGDWKTYPPPTRESFTAFRKHQRRFF